MVGLLEVNGVMPYFWKMGAIRFPLVCTADSGFLGFGVEAGRPSKPLQASRNHLFPQGQLLPSHNRLHRICSLDTSSNSPILGICNAYSSLKGKVVRVKATSSDSSSMSTAIAALSSSEDMLVPGVQTNSSLPAFQNGLDDSDSNAETSQVVKEESDEPIQREVECEDPPKVVPPPGNGQRIYEIDPLLKNYRSHLEYRFSQCKKTLLNLGYAEFTFEDFFAIFVEQLGSVLPGRETSISIDTLVERSRDPLVSNYVVMFFRFVTSGEIRRRAEFSEPFILGMSNVTVEQFCKASVEPMGEESDHVHVIALSDALGVPIRVVYLDRSSCDVGKTEVNHHDFIPSNCLTADTVTVKPFVVLLYRPGHYDILYPK